MSQSGRIQTTSVALAQKGQAVPSENGPLPIGSEPINLRLDNFRGSLSEPIEQKPVTDLTSEVVQRGRTRSQERSERVGTEETALKSDDIEKDSRTEATASASNQPVEEPNSSQEMSGFKYAALFVVIAGICAIISWVAFYA